MEVDLTFDKPLIFIIDQGRGRGRLRTLTFI
jgi:hypothetical protein